MTRRETPIYAFDAGESWHVETRHLNAGELLDQAEQLRRAEQILARTQRHRIIGTRPQWRWQRSA